MTSASEADEALRRRVSALLVRGRHEAALAQILAVWHRRPAGKQAWVAILAADVVLGQGERMAAQVWLDRAEALEPSDAEAPALVDLRSGAALVETPLASRHRAQQVGLEAFGSRILATCPRCGGAGTVTGALHGRAAFGCGSCTFAAQGTWLGPATLTGEARCGSCGAKGLSVSRPHRVGHRSPGTLPVTCAGCGATHHVEVGVQRPAYPLAQDPPLEWRMGLPLWLAISIRHGWLWALNAEHLDELRHLIAADLRQTGDFSSSWGNRLPAWMTKASNRAEIGRALDKLRAKLPPT